MRLGTDYYRLISYYIQIAQSEHGQISFENLPVFFVSGLLQQHPLDLIIMITPVNKYRFSPVYKITEDTLRNERRDNVHRKSPV